MSRTPSEDDDARAQGGPSGGALIELTFDRGAGMWRGKTHGYADTFVVQATVDGDTYDTQTSGPAWPMPVLLPADHSIYQPATLQWMRTITPNGSSSYFVLINVIDLATGQATHKGASSEQPDDGVEEIPGDAFPMPGRYEIRMEQTMFGPVVSKAAHDRDDLSMWVTLVMKTQIDVKP